jgi:hypothetical protein
MGIEMAKKMAWGQKGMELLVEVAMMVMVVVIMNWSRLEGKGTRGIIKISQSTPS